MFYLQISVVHRPTKLSDISRTYSTHYPHIHFTTNLSIYHLKMSQSLTRSKTTQNSGHFFCDVLGAMDGTHINCNPSASKCQSAWNRKGGVTQNCLAVAALTFGFNIC